MAARKPEFIAAAQRARRVIRPRNVVYVVLVVNALGCGCRERAQPAPTRPPAAGHASASATPAVATPTAVPSVVAADLCQETLLCVQFGRCSYRAVQATEGQSWSAVEPSAKWGEGEMRSCVALSDADCARSETACREQGQCSARNGVCVAASDSQCGASRFCEQHGSCVAVAGFCQLGEGLSCAQTKGCRSHGACDRAELFAESIPDIYFASKKSLLAKLDSTATDMWAPPVPLIEPRSFWIANQHANIHGCAALRTASCRASEVCKTDGACVARDGECRRPY